MSQDVHEYTPEFLANCDRLAIEYSKDKYAHSDADLTRIQEEANIIVTFAKEFFALDSKDEKASFLANAIESGRVRIDGLTPNYVYSFLRDSTYRECATYNYNKVYIYFSDIKDRGFFIQLFTFDSMELNDKWAYSGQEYCFKVTNNKIHSKMWYNLKSSRAPIVALTIK